MRGMWAVGGGLLLGLVAAGVQAEEVAWHAAVAGAAASAETAAPSAASLGRPVPAALATAAPQAALVAGLGRPVPTGSRGGVPVGASRFTDPGVSPASYSPVMMGTPSLTARGQEPERLRPVPQPEPQQGPALIETPEEPRTGKSPSPARPQQEPVLIETPEEEYNQGVVTTRPPARPPVTVLPGPGTVVGPAPLPGTAPCVIAAPCVITAPCVVPAPCVPLGGYCGKAGCGGEAAAACGATGGEAACRDACPCDCGRPWSFWVSGAYLFWNIRDDHPPALVTTSPQASRGVLGAPGTVVLFGNTLDHEEFSGGRLTAGLWLDACKCYGLEGSFFFLAERTARFSQFSPGNPLLARPIFNTATGMEGAELVAATGVVIPGTTLTTTLAGRITVTAPSEMWGAELNGLVNLERGPHWQLNLLGGFRYLRLREQLNIREDLVATLDTTGAVLGTDLIEDLFATRNDFYGGQIGLRSEWAWKKWRLDLTGKVAVGDTHEVVDINFVRVNSAPFPGFIPSGLLAAPTNAGHFTRDRFSFVPQAGINFGYQFTEHWRAFVGYDFLYWSKVARPGNEIDRVVNPAQVAGNGLGGPGTGFPAGPARPAFTFRDSAFWAYGASAGIEFRY